MEITITVPFEATALKDASQKLRMWARALDAPVAALPAASSGAIELSRVGAPISDNDVANATGHHIDHSDPEQITPSAVFTAPVPPPPSAVAPIPPPSSPAVEVDSAGVPWTKGVHADNKAKKQDGTWKTRRGTKKAPPRDASTPIGEVEIPELQAAVGKLLGANIELASGIERAISQTVLGDLSKTHGGMEKVLKTGDKRLAGRAMNALKAIGLQHGVAL